MSAEFLMSNQNKLEQTMNDLTFLDVMRVYTNETFKNDTRLVAEELLRINDLNGAIWHDEKKMWYLDIMRNCVEGLLQRTYN